MEAIGATDGEQWSSSLGALYTTEEADFMAQLLGGFSFTNDHQGHEEGSLLSLPSTFWPNHEPPNAPTSPDELHHSSDHHHPANNLSDPDLFFSQESFTSNASTKILFPDPIHGTLLHHHQNGSCQFFPTNNDLTESLGFLSTENLIQLDRQCIEGEDRLANADIESHSNENSKKRSQKADIEKGKRNVKSKKNLKIVPPCNFEEDILSPTNVQGSSSSCSDNESNAASEEVANGGENASLSPKVSPSSLNINGKTRASRGSATDPQSLYARRRRERINERLRILQNLVPNGTKVDISTMLEEAVQYVKFLQLQIKLLSSDDLWMYAPLAYNGMDIGIDLKTPFPK